MDEIFDSSVRPQGDLAGVFEHDGDAGYFYLYATEGGAGSKVLDSIHIISGEPDFAEGDISIQWDAEKQKVGLFIKALLWAVFDCRLHIKHGGSYKPGAQPSLPLDAISGF